MALLRKSMPMVAWYVLSKVSYMNLFIPMPNPISQQHNIDINAALRKRAFVSVPALYDAYSERYAPSD